MELVETFNFPQCKIVFQNVESKLLIDWHVPALSLEPGELRKADSGTESVVL